MSVRTGRGAGAEQRGERHPVLRVHQPRQGYTIAVLAQMPCRQPAELALRHQSARLGHAGVTEIGRVGEDGRQDRTRIVVCPAGSQMREAAGEAGPAIDIGEQIGDPDRGQMRVEWRQCAFRFVGRDRTQG